MKEEEKERPLELLPVSVEFRVIDGVLTPDGLINKIRLETFLKQIGDNHRVSVTYELLNDDKSFAQLAKVHACIKEIAKYTGHSPLEIKKIVKMNAHLYSDPETLKSFADCSKSELGLAIEAAISLGDSLGVNINQL